MALIKSDRTVPLMPMEEQYRRMTEGKAHFQLSLVGQHINNLYRHVETPPRSPNFAETGAANPKLRVFVAHFDGTWNDKDAVPKGESKTITALLYEELQKQQPKNVKSHYSHGVGTRTTFVREGIEAATGDGCELRANKMFASLCEEAAKWRAEETDVEIHVHAVGFSRGAATALHFLNLVDTHGAIMPNQSVPKYSKIKPGDVKSSAVLFDTVATGQERILNLTIPNTTQSVLHITAGAEERRHFAVTSINDRRYDTKGRDLNTANVYEWATAKNVLCPPPPAGHSEIHFTEKDTFIYPRVQQITLSGARHSDVGGGYIQNGIGGVPMYLARTFQSSLGIHGAQPVRPTMQDMTRAKAHDSRDTIELGLQFIEGLLGRQRLASTDAKRKLADEQSRKWNGDLIRTATIKTLDSYGMEIGSRTISMVVPHKEGEPLPTLKDLAKNKHLIYTPGGSLKGMANPFVSEPNGAFVITKKGVIEFMGQRVDDSHEKDSLCKAALSYKTDCTLVIDITDRRMFCDLQDGKKKNVEPGQRMITTPIPEPWPKGAVSSLLELNDRTHLDPAKTAKSIIDLPAGRTMAMSAFQDVAEQLGEEFENVEAISYKVRAPFYGKPTVQLTAIGSDGQTITSSRDKVVSKDDALIHQRLKDCTQAFDTMLETMQKINCKLESFETVIPAKNHVDYALQAESSVSNDEEPVSPLRKYRPR